MRDDRRANFGVRLNFSLTRLQLDTSAPSSSTATRLYSQDPDPAPSPQPAQEFHLRPIVYVIIAIIILFVLAANCGNIMRLML